MDENIIIIMQKDTESGFFEKEFCTLKIDNYIEMILSIFVYLKDNQYFAEMKLTTGKDVSNWEFNAVLDYYDTEFLKGESVEIDEVADTYNPTWRFIFPYNGSEEGLLEMLSFILDRHNSELQEVYSVILDKKDEYSEK